MHLAGAKSRTATLTPPRKATRQPTALAPHPSVQMRAKQTQPKHQGRYTTSPVSCQHSPSPLRPWWVVTGFRWWSGWLAAQHAAWMLNQQLNRWMEVQQLYASTHTITFCPSTAWLGAATAAPRHSFLHGSCLDHACSRLGPSVQRASATVAVLLCIPVLIHLYLHLHLSPA